MFIPPPLLQQLDTPGQDGGFGCTDWKHMSFDNGGQEERQQGAGGCGQQTVSQLLR